MARLYFAPVERPLKERLIGAAVLVAAAVILVPEMLSGPDRDPRRSPEADSTAIKTYSVDLQQPAYQPVMPAAEKPEQREESSSETPAPRAAAAEKTTADAQETDAPAAEPPSTPQVNAPSEAERSAVPSPPTSNSTLAPSAGKNAGWAVQVGSFASPATAQGLARKLESQGFNAFVRSVNINGKQLYRVRVGPMADRGDAEATLAKLKTKQPGASIVPQ